MTYSEFKDRYRREPWFKQYKANLQEYRQGRGWDIRAFFLHDMSAQQWLDCAFGWGGTPEGIGYWNRIFTTLPGV